MTNFPTLCILDSIQLVKKTCMLYADDMKVETKLTSGAKKSNVRNKG